MVDVCVCMVDVCVCMVELCVRMGGQVSIYGSSCEGNIGGCS